MPTFLEQATELGRFLLFGAGSAPQPSSPLAQPTAASPAPGSESDMPAVLTTRAFESHVAEANYATQTAANKGSRAISLAWDENEGMGIRAGMRQVNGLPERQRKETLLKAYLSNPWVSACVDVIAKRITSGGFSIEPTKMGEGSDANREKLLAFCLLVNEHWDFLQFLRSIITDLLIFGEAYAEIVFKGGVPWKLYKIDCLTMSYQLDPHGNIMGYQQQLASTQKPVSLDPKTIIRWWLPHPGASMTALSPMERSLNAVNLDGKMVNWVTTFFSKGARAPFWIKAGGEAHEAERYLEWFEQEYTGENNAHLPFVTWGDGEIREFKAGAVDIDFKFGRQLNREEILAAYNVPPAAVGIIETAHLGSGNGESQAKDFQFNACDPIKQLILEKFNFVVVQQGFKIPDYLITTRYADYRSDDAVAKLQDMRIRNGTRTIDETRQEDGKQPYGPENGGETPIFTTTKDIIPLPRLTDMEDEQRQQTQFALQTAQAQAELQAAQAEKAKIEAEKAKNPDPVPAPLQAFQQGQQPPTGATSPGQGQGQGQQSAPPAQQAGQEKPEQQDGDDEDESQPSRAKKAAPQETDAQRPQLLQQHTGMMLSFLLDGQTASDLALPGGEPAADLHVTLCYLGDMAEAPQPDDDRLRPHTSPFKICDVIAAIASQTQPLSGRVTGLGRFTPAESETDLVIALVDVPGLSELRNRLNDAIVGVGYFVANNHGYTPHITLAYIPHDAPMPVGEVPPLPLRFERLCLAIGDQRIFFTLGAAPCTSPDFEESEQAQEPQEAEEALQASEARRIWQPDDIDGQVADLQGQGHTHVTWESGGTACAAICAQNDGVTVRLGETFPSGHRLPPGHPNCDCGYQASTDDADGGSRSDDDDDDAGEEEEADA